MSSANKPKMKGYALIRDKNGRPKIDDINHIPKEIWEILTDEDKEYIHGAYTLNRRKKYAG